MKNTTHTPSMSNEKFKRSNKTAFSFYDHDTKAPEITPEITTYLDITANLEKDHKTKACGGVWFKVR